MDEVLETIENSEVETSETVLDSQEDSPALDESEIVVEETELVVLQRIDTTLTHLDSVTHYGVSLMIIFMLVLILHYIYKFFRMFF